MGRLDARLAHLRRVPMFGSFTDKELRLVANVVEDVGVRDGEVLVKQGQRGHEFYVLADGKAEVSRDGRSIAVLGPGDHFGELAVLDPQPRNATVTMRSDGEVLILSQREFYALLTESPTLSRKLLISLARRIHTEAAVRAEPASLVH